MSDHSKDMVWVMDGCRGDEQFRFRKTLPQDGDLILGRHKQSFIPLASKYASRQHLKLSLKNGVCSLTCMGKLNGTFRNDVKVKPHETVLLKHKDRVTVGHVMDPLSSFSFTVLHEPVDKENSVRKDDQVPAHVVPDDWKLDQDVVVVMEQLSAERVANLLPDKRLAQLLHQPAPHVTDPPLVTIDSDLPIHSSHSSSNHTTSRPQNRTSVPMPAQTVTNINNKRKPSDSARPAAPEKRLKTVTGPAQVPRPVPKATSSATSSSTSTRLTNGTGPAASSGTSGRPQVRQTLATITPSKRSDVLSGIIGPEKRAAAPTANLKERMDKFLKQKRLEKNQTDLPRIPKKITIPIVDPAPLTTGSRQGYATAGARLPVRNPGLETPPHSPPLRPLSPTDETAGTSRPQRVAHQTRPAATVPTTAALLMKNQVPAENAVRPVPQRAFAPRPKVNVDQHLHDILSWNLNWFKEATRISDEPELTTMPTVPLKTSYDSYKEYADTLIPYVLYEIWANLIEAYQRNTSTSAGQNETFTAHVTSSQERGCFLELTAELPCIRDRNRTLLEGDMVMVDICTMDVFPHNNQPIKFIGLGFICNIRYETRFTAANKPYPIPPGCQKILIATMFVRKTQMLIDQGKSIQILRLDYIRPQLKHIEAVLTLEYSKLMLDILRPRQMVCQIPFPRDDNLGNDKYNKSQHEAILGSAEGVKRGRNLSKIMMIQGPPGTGKTHTLVGVVKEIYNTWHPWKRDELPKILVCAPSNGAVDEIGKRLFAERNFLRAKDKTRQLRCVRMGLEENVKSECQHITLDRLVEENMRKGHGYEEQIKKLEEEMAHLDIEISNHRVRNNFEEAKRTEVRLDAKSKELNRIRTSKACQGSEQQQERKVRDDVLSHSDVILTTLNSCRTSYLDSMFNINGPLQFDCVIIDEASQCSEPELLMPLCYASITKVILIGDPMQLPPTVKSKKAAEKGYGTSLFERFFKFFGGYNDKTPVLTLTTQFRMHYEICKFPSHAFYDNRLLTDMKAGYDMRFPFKFRYNVFDLKGTTHSSDDPKNIFNLNEATFIVKQCVLLNKILPAEKTVGIITPYRGQMKLIRDKLLNERNFTIRIDVNTIDGFQGQERDVIIFSSVRSSDSLGAGVGFLGSHQRMNVALTRAKYGLIVVLSKSSMSVSRIWQNLIDDAEKRNLLRSVRYNEPEDSMRQILVNPDVENIRN
jgi:hypothetical protein